MAKRPYPFTEDYIPQSKVYVSLKRFNNNEEKLEKVYENTLQLLFNGAKKAHLPVDNRNVEPENKKDGMKQLVIGKNGSLLVHSEVKIPQKRKLVNCKCGNEKQVICCYCEENLCGDCRRICILCLQYYCMTCTLPKFEESDICYSCYR